MYVLKFPDNITVVLLNKDFIQIITKLNKTTYSTACNKGTSKSKGPFPKPGYKYLDNFAPVYQSHLITVKWHYHKNNKKQTPSKKSLINPDNKPVIASYAP